MRRLKAVVLVMAVMALACGKGGSFDTGGTGGFEDALVTCDPTASVYDDLFLFEAWTWGQVNGVDVDVYVGSDRLRTVSLSERSGGAWYEEAWADDLQADCDEFDRMAFTFVLEDSEGTLWEASVAP